METKPFMEKTDMPNNEKLQKALGNSFELWQTIKHFVLTQYPKGIEDWNFPGAKYGWSFRIKDKKRAIIYFLPFNNYFKVAFVFGQKATDIIMQSNINGQIKKELIEARVYAEGRGIRLEVKDYSAIPDIMELIKIKLSN